MIDHFGIQVSNLESSKVFYQKTLLLWDIK